MIALLVWIGPLFEMISFSSLAVRGSATLIVLCNRIFVCVFQPARLVGMLIEG